MKRFLSILLTVVLSLSVVAALPVYAEGTDGAFKVGDQNYATLAEAYAALPEEGGVIELVANYESATDVGLTFAKPVTIKAAEGTDYTITLTAACNADSRWISTTAALNLENIVLNTTRGIEATGTSITAKNCELNMAIAPFKTSTSIDHWVNDGFDFFVLSSGSLTLDGTNVTYNSDLTIKDGKLANTNVNIVVVKLSGADNTFNMINESSIEKTGWATCRDAGNGAVYVGKNGSANISIGDRCSITVDVKCDNVRSVRSISCINLHGTGATASVTLGEDSVLSLGNSFITTNNSYYPGWISVLAAPPSNVVTIVDNGCTYTVTPDPTFSPNDTARFKANIIPFFNVSNAEAGETYYTADGETFTAGANHPLVAGKSYEIKFGTPSAPAAKSFTVVGGEDFETLADAIAAAADNATIILNRDYTSATDTGIVTDKALTIKSAEGEKYTVTISAASETDARWIKTAANLTLENIVIETTRGIEISSADLTLKNVTATMTGEKGSASGQATHSFIKATGADVVLNNTTITQKVISFAQAVCLMGESTLELISNSHIVSQGNVTQSSSLARSMTVVADVSGTANKVYITVGDGCSISNENTRTSSSLRPAAAIAVWRSGSTTTEDQLIVTLKNGSKLSVLTQVVSYSGYRSGWFSNIETAGAATAGITVVDEGCTYAVKYVKSVDNSESRFDHGKIYFPTISTTDTDKKFISSTGDVPVDNGGSYVIPVGDYGKIIEFKFTAPATPLVTNIAGASIRTDSPLAIRFGATVNAEEYAKLVAEGKTVKFGMIITPDASVIENFVDVYSWNIGEPDADFICAEWTYEELNANGEYSLSMYVPGDDNMENISAEYLTKTFYGCAYYIVDGEYVMAEEAVARSIYDVANAYKTTVSADNAYINSIVARVDNANA